MNNLEFWNSVEKTDPQKTKKAKKGQLSLTAINATSQIKAATEKWGQYGDTWGLDSINYSFMDIEDNKIAIVKAVFYYPNTQGHECSFPINSSLKMSYVPNGKDYLKIDDDFCKKLETDVTTKALSKLGFNADVFMGLYDDNRYVMALQEEFHPKPKPKPFEGKLKPEAVKQAVERIKNGEDTLIEKMKAKYDLTVEEVQILVSENKWNT